ncbi:MAG: hypothetical protein ACRDMX_00905, partial [Solirubrobacteraceae bacterium]
PPLPARARALRRPDGASMIALDHVHDVAPAQALRCRCPRPCEIVIDDECRCLKCGRRPAVRLHAAPGDVATGQPGLRDRERLP